jgi:pyruvate,water dikinase
VTDCVALASARDESRFGGKAVSLGQALRASLPVPDGFALDVELVEAIVRGDAVAGESLEQAFAALGGPAAVRSSAVGEDAKDASFAGQHVTLLNVCTVDALAGAVGEVYRSAHSASALSYRRRLCVEGAPRIAVVVQQLIEPVSAGVLFTRNPSSGAEERVIEAAWGLGEVVVSGLVVPDFYRLGHDGDVLERTIGEKDLAMRTSADGGTEEIAVDASLIHGVVLDDRRLGELHGLACRCESVYGRDLDIEWAFSPAALHLLQCRSITRTSP